MLVSSELYLKSPKRFLLPLEKKVCSDIGLVPSGRCTTASRASSHNRVGGRSLLCLTSHHDLITQGSNLCNVGVHKTFKVLAVQSHHRTGCPQDG